MNSVRMFLKAHSSNPDLVVLKNADHFGKEVRAALFESVLAEPPSSFEDRPDWVTISADSSPTPIPPARHTELLRMGTVSLGLTCDGRFFVEIIPDEEGPEWAFTVHDNERQALEYFLLRSFKRTFFALNTIGEMLRAEAVRSLAEELHGEIEDRMWDSGLGIWVLPKEATDEE